MSFNLTTAGYCTPAQVAALLASVEDDRHWRLAILKTGDVILVDRAQEDTLYPGYHAYHCFSDTYSHGGGYVGPAAASDAAWVQIVTDQINQNWPNTRPEKYIDH